jgi:hypothetical protein
MTDEDFCVCATCELVIYTVRKLLPNWQDTITVDMSRWSHLYTELLFLGITLGLTAHRRP